MASTGAPKKIALNAYLLKPNPDPASKSMWSERDLLARPVGASGKPSAIKAEKHSLGPEGKYGVLYIRKPVEAEPEWIDFVRRGLIDAAPLSRLKNRSVSALLVIEVDGRQFALAFGHGRFMIEPRLVEDRFGIRVVLNSISPDKVASMDRQTFDASPRISRTQTIKASSVSGFMISPEQDLLRALVGFTLPAYQKTLGTLIAGMDSFKTSLAINLDELSGVLHAALERSLVKEYLLPDAEGNHSQFAWVENLQPVKDKALIDQLERKLWAKLHSGDLAEMWLAVPDIVDWSDVTGFSYFPAATVKEEIETSLDLRKFISSLRKGASIETIKNREILMLMAAGTPPQRLNAFKCIYAEIKDKAQLFILNVGTWFKVEPSFQQAVENYFDNLPRKPFAPPFVEYAHSGEGQYNEAVCAALPSNYALLDRRLVKFGGTYDKIEVCDIFKAPAAGKSRGMEFIHVKRGRGSSTLSHLFAQGLVAATLMVKESTFVSEVNKQLTTQGFPPLVSKFNAAGNELVYAIIDRAAGTVLDLPFFSKVTLQNCGKTISAFGFTVSLLHIPESAAHLATVAAKTSKKAATKSKRPSKTTGSRARRSGVKP